MKIKDFKLEDYDETHEGDIFVVTIPEGTNCTVIENGKVIESFRTEEKDTIILEIYSYYSYDEKITTLREYNPAKIPHKFELSKDKKKFIEKYVKEVIINGKTEYKYKYYEFDTEKITIQDNVKDLTHNVKGSRTSSTGSTGSTRSTESKRSTRSKGSIGSKGSTGSMRSIESKGSKRSKGGSKRKTIKRIKNKK